MSHGSPQTDVPAPQTLSSSSTSSVTTDGLPACCSDDFRQRLRRGDVPQFGCYDPVYMRPPLQPADEASGLPSSAFFPSFSSLVRQYVAQRERASAPSGGEERTGEEKSEAAEDALDGLGFGRSRPTHSWEHVTSAEDLWNGPPLTTKIPPASDYERILLDRA